MKNNLKAHLALFTVALLYGGNFSIAKIVMDDSYIEPLGFIILRALSGLVLFWMVHYFFIQEKIEKKDFPLLILCAVFGVAINQMTFFMGLQRTTPINASLIMLTTPILVLIISMLVIKEKITLQKLIGIIFGATGAIMLITYGKEISYQSSQIWGDILVFINALSFGIYLVLVKKLMVKYHPFTVMKWVFSFGIFMVLPFGFHDLKIVEWSTFPNVVWWAVFYVLIGATCMTYLLNAYALKMVNASVVSIYIYLQPLFATLIALALDKDELDGLKVFAGILIFIGVYLVSFQISKPTLHQDELSNR